MKLRLNSQQAQLDNLFAKVSEIKDDEEIRSHLTRYLCVQTSGFLENVIKSLVSDYIEKSCPVPIKTFVTKKVDRITNLNNKKLSDFLNSFSRDWLEKYGVKISEQQATSLNSIIANRNAIAHGGPSNINYTSMKEYYNDLKDVVIVLQDVIKKK